MREMSERDLDLLLESSLSELPPDAVAARVTPWKTVMGRILTGIALNAITLNFWCLNYILPLTGLLLTLLGFRGLRQENRWFRAGFVTAVLRLTCFVPQLILNASIYSTSPFFVSVGTVLTLGGLFFQVLSLLCLWQGLGAVQKKAELLPRTGWAGALVLWHAALMPLYLLQDSGLLVPIFWIMVPLFFLILFSLSRVVKVLDETGYAIRPTFLRLPDRGIVLTVLGLILAGAFITSLLWGSYPMDWQRREPGEQDKAAETRAVLLELGFPREVLDDLRPEEIAACDGAVEVLVKAPQKHPSGVGQLVESGEEKRVLQITNAAVRLPGETWVFFHHFLWTEPPVYHNPRFRGTEAIRLRPATRDYGLGLYWDSEGELTGRLLWDQSGQTWTAPYHFLGEESYTTEDFFWGTQSATEIFGTFSLPGGGERQRGYVTYAVRMVRPGCVASSEFLYTHQSAGFLYPARTAMEEIKAGGWNDERTFLTLWDGMHLEVNGEEAVLH